MRIHFAAPAFYSAHIQKASLIETHAQCYHVLIETTLNHFHRSGHSKYYNKIVWKSLGGRFGKRMANKELELETEDGVEISWNYRVKQLAAWSVLMPWAPL